jgi:hypothetical protein
VDSSLWKRLWPGVRLHDDNDNDNDNDEVSKSIKLSAGLKTPLSNRTVICNDISQDRTVVLVYAAPSAANFKKWQSMAAKRACWFEFFHGFVSFLLTSCQWFYKNNFTSSLYLQPTILPQNCLDPELTKFAHCDCAVSKLSKRTSRRYHLCLCCSNSVTGKPIRSRIRVCNGAYHPTLS